MGTEVRIFLSAVGKAAIEDQASRDGFTLKSVEKFDWVRTWDDASFDPDHPKIFSFNPPGDAWIGFGVR